MEKKIGWLGVISVYAVLVGHNSAEARLLRIIHTNDMHAHLEPHLDSYEDIMTGGYAAVRGTIMALKNASAEEGVETIVLDAGDFSEGSVFFLADQGYQTFNIMGKMGFDAVAFGNHDWLLGRKKLEAMMKKLPPDYKVLAANYRAEDDQPETDRRVKPYTEFERAGLKVGVLGLTTDELFYNWIVRKKGHPFPIWDPLLTAKLYLPELRKRNDLVIALTHIGLDKDKALAKATDDIDLIVGGHSHDLLREPVFQRNKKDRKIPIVQAGKHGEYVGEMTINFEPGHPVEVLAYRLIRVTAQAPVDPVIEKEVKQVRAALYQDYSESWLNEPLGESEVPISVHGEGRDEWAELLTEAIRSVPEAKHLADVSMDVPEFGGARQPAGTITREKLFTLYPRLFGDAEPRFGWTVWVVKTYGVLLENALKVAAKFGFLFSVSGATFEYENSKVKNIRIGGKKIKPLKLYTLALPEGIARGALGISKALKLILKNPKNTGIPIWAATELKVKRIGGNVRRRTPATTPPMTAAEDSTTQIINPDGIR